jgi:RimJ/RimL family protein N-acetyltransferase
MAGFDQINADFSPVTLTGRYVRLEPLQASHHAGFCDAGLDASIWQWSPAPVTDQAGMRAYVDEALAMQRDGKALPFAIRLQHDGRSIGSTRYCAIEAAHRRAEIGWTWLNPSVQRTPVNTECKYLLLHHAFETLGLNRVELKTDSLNATSRAAMARIGAVEEGIFRNHMVTASGRIRHTVYLSIVREEWPQVRASLEQKLARPFSFTV